MNESQAAVFQAGDNVGKLTEQLFPGGVDALLADAFSYQQTGLNQLDDVIGKRTKTIQRKLCSLE